jgi:hypothetical protein
VRGEEPQAGAVGILVGVDQEIVVGGVGRRPGQAGDTALELAVEQAIDEEDLLVGALRRDDRRHRRRAMRGDGGADLVGHGGARRLPRADRPAVVVARDGLHMRPSP